MECPRCGQKIEAKAFFCPRCGQKLEKPSEPLTWTDQKQPSQAAQATRRGCRPTAIVVGIAALVVILILGGIAGAIYLGVRDRSRAEMQAAQDHYLKGNAQLEQGNIELAIAEYELALQLNPNHKEAAKRLAQAQETLQVKPTATPVLQEQTKEAYWNELQAAYKVGNWEGVYEAANKLLALDPTYHREEVDALLFKAFYRQGQELVEQDRMEEALRYFDRALSLQPDNVQAQHAQNMVKRYIEALSYWGADWEQAAEQLAVLYALDPDYKDVHTRLYEALTHYGDALAAAADWCAAAQQYASALELNPTAAVTTKHREASDKCQSQTGVSPAPTQGGLAETPTKVPSPIAPAGTFVGRLEGREKAGSNKMFIRGRVLTRNAEGLPDVKVKIQAWDWSTVAVTDGQGNFAFDGLANPVTYTLSLLDLPSQPVDVMGVWGEISWVTFQEQ